METSRHAVVIGVNNYEDEHIPELKGAENDAKELRQRLADQDSGGFDIAEGHFLTGQEATCLNIRQALSDLLWKTDSSDLSLFYFSGHGFQDEYGNSYIAPWDMRRTEPLVRGIRMSELKDLLLAAKMKRTVLMILDCCYSGSAIDAKGGAGVEAPPLKEFSDLRGEDTGEARIVLASAGKDERSRERPKCEHTLAVGTQTEHPHGVFTYHLLEGLDGKAAGENYEITWEGLRKYIDTQMADDPEHKPTVFTVGSQLDRITIARASQWNKINENLRRAKEFLQHDEPDAVFDAAQALRDIISQYVTLPEAIHLKSTVDEKLAAYRDPANWWLMGKREEPWLQFRVLFRELGILAGDLSVDSIISQTPQMQTLLVLLCGVSSKRPGSNQTYASEKELLIKLKGYLSAQSQATSVAEPKSPGQGKTQITP